MRDRIPKDQVRIRHVRAAAHLFRHSRGIISEDVDAVSAVLTSALGQSGLICGFPHEWYYHTRQQDKDRQRRIPPEMFKNASHPTYQVMTFSRQGGKLFEGFGISEDGIP